MAAEADTRDGGWGTTVAEHKQRQLLRIGQVAADLAIRDGLAAVSMSQLARASGVSRATLYNYVPDVATAISRYLEAQAEAFHLTVTSAIADEDGPEARLRRYIREQVAYVAGTDHRAAVALAEAGVALGGAETAASHRQRHRGALDDILAEGIRDGVFRESTGAAHAILINRLLYSAHDLLHDQQLSEPEVRAAIIDLVLDGIRPHSPGQSDHDEVAE